MRARTRPSLAAAGSVTFFASPFGVEPEPTPTSRCAAKSTSRCRSPTRSHPDVRSGLEAILRSQQLFAVHGEGLSLITCRKRAGEYTIGIANNTWREQPFRLESLCGQIESLRELPLDQSEKGRRRARRPRAWMPRNSGKNSARHDRRRRRAHLRREGEGSRRGGNPRISAAAASARPLPDAAPRDFDQGGDPGPAHVLRAFRRRVRGLALSARAREGGAAKRKPAGSSARACASSWT